ncbi:transmembrane protein 247 isoform X1 [Coturnix japonica]|uniref:transmembrane protein 247 isoform X1 n=1 Tax=Coturnix japonica TaxID=93934 RepID=UPI0007774E5B|nr:transmembrane protein 247 isoform X1 [Coturnix japonica]XP_032299726.1 transmembrane protein 247 isoform X1 [Coturnix japonica]
MQGDLKESNSLKELRYSFQRAMDNLEKDIELTLQETQNNDNKRQQQVKMVCGKFSSSRCKTTVNHGGRRSARKLSAKQGAMRDIPTSYFVSDYTTENTDARSHMAHLDVTGRTSALQSEVSTNVEEQKELCCMQVTAADIELQRMWCNFMLAGQKYELEDSDKQRLHEERMTRIRQQFSQGLQDRLLPPNQTVLFLYSFIFMYIIYIAKDLVFYFFQNHYQFSFAIVFFFILKGIFQD